MKQRVIAVGGGKGGVGKSTIALALVDYLQSAGDSIAIVESDNSNPDVFKTYNKLGIECTITNLDDESGFIRLGSLIESHPHATIVVNTAARATKNLIAYSSILADVVAETAHDLIMLWPINRQRDSLELLTDFVEKADGHWSTYAVINTYFGSEDKFSRFNSSKIKNKLTSTIVFPELNDLIADKLVDNRLPIDSGSGMSIAEKSALGRYRRDAHNALKVIHEQ